MRENIVQTLKRGADQRTYIEDDWFNQGIPANAVFNENVYLDTSYGFAGFRSRKRKGLFMDEGSGCYEIVSFIVSEQGKITVGKFSIVNGATLICNSRITIGDHCMIAWGATITDTWMGKQPLSLQQRQELLKKAGSDPLRRYPFHPQSAPVLLENNCWVGFEAVIMPGVRLGEGCIIGCKTVVTEDVPPYAVVAGNPARIVKYLQPGVVKEERKRYLAA